MANKDFGLPPKLENDKVLEESEYSRDTDYEFVSSFDQIAARVYAIADKNGFWENGQNRNKPEMIALIHSELSEALEALRKDPFKPDEKCPDFTNLEIELADTVIRIMDMAYGLNLDLSNAILEKINYNKNRPYKHGKKF